MPCNSYKEFLLSNCPSKFQVIANLTPYITINWELKNKFNTKFIGQSSTDENGMFEIIVDIDHGITPDLFQSFSGAWELRGYGIDNVGNDTQIVFCSQYNFAVLIFEKTVPPPGPNNAVIDFGCDVLT